MSFDHEPLLAAEHVILCAAADLVRLPRLGVRLGSADHLQHHPRPVALERLHPQQCQPQGLHGRRAGGAILLETILSLTWVCLHIGCFHADG